MAILGFWGFAMTYAMRFNISIAIVSMVNQTYISDLKAKAHMEEFMSNGNGMMDNFTVSSHVGAETCAHLKAGIMEGRNASAHVEEEDGEFNWNPYEQGIILSSFFWGKVTQD